MDEARDNAIVGLRVAVSNIFRINNAQLHESVLKATEIMDRLAEAIAK